MSFQAPVAIWGRPSGDVKLWVPFNNDLDTDVSVYANSATNSGATITGGQLSISGTTLQTLTYGATSVFGHATGEAYTLEAFAQWTSSANATEPGNFFNYTIGTTQQRFGLYANAGKVVFHTSGAAYDAGPTASNVMSGVGKVHVAMVRPAGTGAQTIRFYVNGSQVLTATENAEQNNANGTIIVGKGTGSGQAATYTVDDVRFTKLELYTGTSFTPPSHPL